MMPDRNYYPDRKSEQLLLPDVVVELLSAVVASHYIGYKFSSFHGWQRAVSLLE